MVLTMFSSYHSLKMFFFSWQKSCITYKNRQLHLPKCTNVWVQNLSAGKIFGLSFWTADSFYSWDDRGLADSMCGRPHNHPPRLALYLAIKAVCTHTHAYINAYFPSTSCTPTVSAADKWALVLPRNAPNRSHCQQTQNINNLINQISATGKGTQVSTIPRARWALRHSRWLAAFFISCRPLPRGLWVNIRLLQITSFRLFFIWFLQMNKTKKRVYEISCTCTQTHKRAISEMPLISAGSQHFCFLHTWLKFITSPWRWLNGCVYHYPCPSHTHTRTGGASLLVFLQDKAAGMLSGWMCLFGGNG